MGRKFSWSGLDGKSAPALTGGTTGSGEMGIAKTAKAG
jgi:hypothetical protein